MIIGGLQKLSLLDYPEHLSAIIFTQGCNFNCQFCYNPMLVGLNGKKIQKDHYPFIKEDDLFEFLQNRVGKLEGVVITGGEPTMQVDLPRFAVKIKNLGFLIKLDTNGANPAVLRQLVENKLINYIAMDVKAPGDKYNKITGVKIDFKSIKKSVKIIMKSNLPYEFRTTIVPGLLNKTDIENMAKFLKGADLWYLQRFKSDTDLVNNALQGIKPSSATEMEAMRKIGSCYVKRCEAR